MQAGLWSRERDDDPGADVVDEAEGNTNHSAMARDGGTWCGRWTPSMYGKQLAREPGDPMTTLERVMAVEGRGGKSQDVIRR